MADKSSAYETESKVDMAKLREAVGRFFAWEPPETPQAERARHRRRREAGSSGDRPTAAQSTEKGGKADSNSRS